MSEVSARPARKALWLLAFVCGVLLAATGAAAYYFYNSLPVNPSLVALSSSDKETDRKINAFCGGCHAFPPPETFPRWDWKHEMDRGFDFFEMYSPPLHPPPREATLKYFE